MSERKSVPDEIVLSFFDAVIHQRDLDLLNGPQWINDAIISFFYEYLEKSAYADHKHLAAFVDPDVAFACSSSEAFADELTRDLKLPEKEHIFLPINNNSDISNAGGNHWSLLYYNRGSNTFFSLDSGGGINLDVAKSAAKNLHKPLLVSSPPYLKEMKVPQQSNGYDCGVYLLCFTEALAERHLRKNNANASLDHITAHFVSTKRREIHDLILHLRNIF